MVAKLLVLCLAVAAMAAQTSKQQEATSANPIRKVVTMIQGIQKKVEAEGEKEKELFDKFMCYCKNGGSTLEKGIADANTKVPQLGSDIEAAESSKVQLTEDLKSHRTDRDAGKAAMAEATAIRDKEAAEFAKEKSDKETNIAALNKAVAALEKGMAGSFLQSDAAQVLRKLTISKQDMLDADRQEILSFLSNGQSGEYSPQSGEITGILKELGDEMAKDLGDATAAEEAAIKGFDELMAAKSKEVAALTKMIEEKTVRVGNVAVEIAMMKNDLGDTAEALIEDKKFLADMEKNCEQKAAEWDERTKTRAMEMAALADTIKVLNDDDALELFKKALPAASSSFVQVKVSSAALRQRALSMILDVQQKVKTGREQLDFIALALRGKKIGFEKVIKMVDDMVATLKTEQLDDNHKKEYCDSQFDLMDDKKKGLERSISDLETAIADAKEGIATCVSDIKALEDGVKALDKSVAEATENRKEENEDFTELMAMDSAAKELIGFAKNRLNKFYNPKLYKAPPKRQITDAEQAELAAGGTLAPTEAPGGIAGTGVTVFAQVSLHVQHKDAPAPPPETFGAYEKKGEASTGVITMMDMIIADLDKEMTEAKAEEKNAQADYEQMMRDSADKRAADSKSLTEKESAKADMEGDLQAAQDDKKSTGNELMATQQVIGSLHAECDWLLQYFDVRKEARDSEIDALGKAKAVLSGADFSF